MMVAMWALLAMGWAVGSAAQASGSSWGGG